MGLKTKVIGRMPTDHGPYDPNLAYGKKFQCELFGCVWESLHDNNNTAPATLVNNTVIANTEDWKIVSGVPGNYGSSQELTDVKNLVFQLESEKVSKVAGKGLSTNDYSNEEKSKVESLESAVGSGGSVDQRIINGVNAEKTRAQAAEAALQAQYNALTQSDLIIGTLPASGVANKIYRVPGTSSYSDYMWNGTQFVLMATYSNGVDNEPTSESENFVKSYGISKALNKKSDLVLIASVSDFHKYPNSRVDDIGFLADGAVEGWDVYNLIVKGGNKINLKVGGDERSDLTSVVFYKLPYFDAGRYAAFIMSSYTILQRGGIKEISITVPEGAHSVFITNKNTVLSVPVIEVYSEKDIAASDTVILNPLKNVFDRNCLILNKKIDQRGGTCYIEDEIGSMAAIIQIKGWGGDYLVFDGFGDVTYSRTVIFLDSNMQPNYDGASYQIPASMSDQYNIALTRPYWNNNRYVAFQLWRQMDFGNKNAANGYVWSDAEIAQGYPNWLNNVIVNFVNFPQVTPNDTDAEKEYCIGDSYDIAKASLFAKVSKEIVGASYDNSKKFNFLFATDSHIDFNYPSKRNVEDMVELANHTSIRKRLDCVIHNGDVATPGYVQDEWNKIDEGYDEYYDIIDKLKVPVIQVSGNHDRHQEHNVPVSHAFSVSKCVNLLKTHSLHTADTLYDYQDFADKKIRVIKLDAFDYPLEDDGTENHYVKYPLDTYDCLVSEAQMQWFVGALLSTPDDYSVVVIGHIYNTSPLVEGITSILAAAANKESGSWTFDYSKSELLLPYSSFTLTYNFTLGHDIKVVGLFGGHSHIDDYTLSNGIHVLNTTCQLLENTNYGMREQQGRAAYTEYQNAFNFISVDTRRNKFRIVRYGYGWPTGIPYNGVKEFDY